MRAIGSVVTAQLILMEPERHVWAQSYDCDMSAVLATQREAARAIAACVATALRPAGAVTPAPVPAGPEGGPVAPEIVEAYLKARFELGQESAEGLGNALQYFREITVKAPRFRARARLACRAVSWPWVSSGTLRPARCIPRAKQMALQAVATDDSLSEAHQVLGWMNWLLDWDLAAAEQEFRRAIELSPSNPDAHHALRDVSVLHGRHSEAIAEAQYALRLESHFAPPEPGGCLVLSLCTPGRTRRRRRPGGPSNSFRIRFSRISCSGGRHGARAGRRRRLPHLRRLSSLSREALSLSFLGHVYARLGRRDEAMRLLRELEQLFAQGRASPIAFVVIYAGLGDTDAALEWLETACRLRMRYTSISPPVFPASIRFARIHASPISSVAWESCWVSQVSANERMG